MNITFRKGTDADGELIIAYLKKLAEYEKLSESCNISAEALRRLMQEENGLHVLIAEQNGRTVGIMTYYFYKIATFSGKRVLYIEDIFIDEEFRGNGIGSRFFTEAKGIAEETDCDRIEWKCLDWNEPAKAFYNRMEGKISSEGWLTYTIDL